MKEGKRVWRKTTKAKAIREPIVEFISYLNFLFVLQTPRPYSYLPRWQSIS
ncbi:hypothetical protein COCCADRAFT_84285 [Bipolaris zeicola 26-R-13]|uniref:Uncharacterized protein n=1 Tax=Cochliobolus carbonum (strain 26-R-13) TaxID=930089 RepID=W6Z2T6_COCC2|nr:uncharacterized protein COCCADRAFT_84285 [Bipolaris zeicola 26-R-13]EUC37996.1 hypothetical protein COCCADRAFT_84285 [Bipolaris zeicola 26-R-13]